MEALPATVAWIVVIAMVAMFVQRRFRHASDVATRRVAVWAQPHSGSWLVLALKRARRLSGHEAFDSGRTALVTGAAAGLGWAAAAGAGLSGPVIAAISATLSVQVSIHSSLKEGFQRLAATLAGILVALGMWQWAGVHVWSVAVIAAASLIIGRLMRLAEAAIAVPATSLGILVLGGTLTSTVLVERVAATALGVVVGAALSPIAGGVTPLERAQAKLGALSTAISDLLTRLGAAAADGYTAEEAAELLSVSRNLDDDLTEARRAADDVSGQARWSLTTTTSSVVPLQSTVRVLAHSIDQVNSIARAMFDAVATPDAPDVPEELAPVLAAAADAFAVHAEVVAETADPGQLVEPLVELREVRQESVHTLRQSIDDTGVWMLTGAILTDLDRMAETLDQTAPALELDVPATLVGIPAMSEVLPAVKDVLSGEVVPARLRRRSLRRARLARRGA